MSRHSALMIVAVLAMVAAGCAGPAPAAGGAPIKIGGIFDLTGGTADVGVPYKDGCVAYVDWMNGKGGINGSKIDLIVNDYAYKVPNAEELYNKYVTQDKVVAVMGWGTGDTEALRPKIAADKIPFMSASYSENLTKMSEAPYNFLIGVTYSDQMRIALRYAKENAPDKSRPVRVAFIYNDSGFGKSPMDDGKAYAKANGIDWVDEQIVALTATDATAQLLNMQKKDPDFAIIQETSNAAATVLKDAKKLGLRTKFIGLNWAADEKVVALSGDAAEGYLGTIPFALLDENLPGHKDILDYLKSKGQDSKQVTMRFVQGWWSMAVLAQGINNAGSNITGENIKVGLEKIKDFDTGGVTSKVTFTPQSHKGALSLRMYQVKGGKWVPFTDFIAAQ